MGQWFRELGSAVVDGAAIGIARMVGPDGSVREGGPHPLTGYSIVSADNLDSAVELTKGYPVLEVSGSVYVHEATAM